MDQQTDDQFERQFFSYVLDATVPANAVQNANQLQILSDADFEWWWVIGSATVATALKVLMKEQATGRDFIGTTASATSGLATFNGIFLSNWAGVVTASAAFPLAVPYIMPAARVYSLMLTDVSGAQQTVELVFNGFKLWPRPKVS